ncbi:MAG: hypothetical protein QM820_03110 [Minicystis sp.]
MRCERERGRYLFFFRFCSACLSSSAACFSVSAARTASLSYAQEKVDPTAESVVDLLKRRSRT